jgi:hypothetical protein
MAADAIRESTPPAAPVQVNSYVADGQTELHTPPVVGLVVSAVAFNNLATTPRAAAPVQEPTQAIIQRLRKDHHTWRDSIQRCIEAAELLEKHLAPAAQQETVGPLKEADVLIMAEAHGIDANTKGLYGFYIDCISTNPPTPTGKAPCARHCEATAFQITIRGLRGEIERIKATGGKA